MRLGPLTNEERIAKVLRHLASGEPVPTCSGLHPDEVDWLNQLAAQRNKAG